MGSNHGDTPSGPLRVDKWLWCARFYRTRRLAAEAVNSGRVRMHGQRLKPARTVQAGDVLSVRRGPYRYTFTILATTPTRQPAAAAAKLYEEHAESLEARRRLAEQVQAGNAALASPRGRPTKRERRKLIRFRRGEE